MRTNPIQFNLIQSKPQMTVNRPMRMYSGLQTDSVSFSGILDIFKKEKTEIPKKTLNDCVPKHKGIIYKKVKDENGNVIKKVPVEADIVKMGAGDFEFEVDHEIVGGVRMSYFKKEGRKDNYSDLYRNYRKEGVVGDRILANYIYNCKGDEYCGVGHLADLLEVACCKELGIKPNVVSHSVPDAAPLHYMRGKRFIPFKKYRSYYHYFYNKKNPNDMVKQIIEKTPKGQKIDASSLKHCILTYMPKEMIKSLEAELKEHPIF